MKKYIEPELEIERLVSKNILTLESVGGGDDIGDDWEDLFKDE